MSQKLLYRPEIDGLRAIAIVSVILYHFNVKIYETTLLNAGSLGVDIFFVISGYLIGLIILISLIILELFSQLLLLTFGEKKYSILVQPFSNS